jgi:HPt (histidine-containing phosphotransfer) domain-containing protein
VVPEHLEQIEAAVDPFDLRRLADAAHSLKSSSAQMGAARLADQCNRVEQLARTGGTSRWIEDVAEIRATVGLTVDALRGYRRASSC